jgi:hypothetical protein
MIGKVVYNILSGYTGLTQYVTTNIFPLVMPVDTPLPSVVYAVDLITPMYSKDGWELDDCSFKVTSYARDYSQVIEVASQVRKALEFQKGTYVNNDIGYIYMESQEEFYQIDADVYIIRIKFKVNINKQ